MLNTKLLGRFGGDSKEFFDKLIDTIGEELASDCYVIDRHLITIRGGLHLPAWISVCSSRENHKKVKDACYAICHEMCHSGYRGKVVDCMLCDDKAKAQQDGICIISDRFVIGEVKGDDTFKKIVGCMTITSENQEKKMIINPLVLSRFGNTSSEFFNDVINSAGRDLSDKIYVDTAFDNERIYSDIIVPTIIYVHGTESEIESVNQHCMSALCSALTKRGFSTINADNILCLGEWQDDGFDSSKLVIEDTGIFGEVVRDEHVTGVKALMSAIEKMSGDK